MRKRVTTHFALPFIPFTVYNRRVRMRYLLRILNSFLDTCLAWFTPVWRRRGHEAISLLSRYMSHYRPHIKPEQMEEMKAARAELRRAILYWRKKDVLDGVKVVQERYADVPGFRRNPWVEILESFFIITVVFLGIRTYFVQPFRIPTNSMWPSLNGIVVHAVDEVPPLPMRVWNALTLGSTYVDVLADDTKRIVDLYDRRKHLLFTETVLRFDDKSEMTIPAASGAVMQYLREQGRVVNTPLGTAFLPYQKGDVIMRARVDAGDMVLVNRMAYHFRRPHRGETFVFDTRGINTNSSSMKEQSGGTHFIKRLCALPGDEVQIESPNVLINGEVCADLGMKRVENRIPPYNNVGYVALDPRRAPTAYLLEGRSVTLSASSPRRPWLREYLALGDNTMNSLDSRYWGPVRQYNILGPAALTIWPFTSHWGTIE